MSPLYNLLEQDTLILNNPFEYKNFIWNPLLLNLHLQYIIFLKDCKVSLFNIQFVSVEILHWKKAWPSNDLPTYSKFIGGLLQVGKLCSHAEHVEWKFWSCCQKLLKQSVIQSHYIEVTQGSIWNKIWDLSWFWAGWQYWKNTFWLTMSNFWVRFFHVFMNKIFLSIFLKTL